VWGRKERTGASVRLLRKRATTRYSPGLGLGTLLKDATLLEFEPARVEVGDLRVEGGRIQASAPRLSPQPGDEVIDLRGRCVMPGLVSGHSLLHLTLLRTHPALSDGLAAPLDQALDLDAVQVSATWGALEALQHGVTTLMDQHASCRAVAGSLLRVARGVNEVGLRGVLSYRVTDQHGALGREEGLEETVAFARKAQGRFRGAVGAHASCNLSEDALEGLRAAQEATGASFHVSVAESPEDERLSRERYERGPVERLLRAGLLSPRARVAHLVHLAWPELSEVLGTGAWLVHTPRMDGHRGQGHAPSGKFGARATVGTGGGTLDVLAEAQLAVLLARSAGQPIDILRYLANGQRMASEVFDAPLGPLREGALADLVVLDYRPATPLSTETLAAHLMLNISARDVEAVMVDGVWRMWARRALSVNVEELAARAHGVAEAMHARLAA
jgi:cytosine/adenosine deaminase-related metal-dependent hydrolase